MRSRFPAASLLILAVLITFTPGSARQAAAQSLHTLEPQVVSEFTSGGDCPIPDIAPRYNNVLYKTVNGVDIKLDIYAPAGPGGPYPGLVFVHGGGWHGLCKEALASEAQMFADNGFVVFSVDYRMACDPANPPAHVDPTLCGYHAPVPVDDVLSAVRWVRQNATTYRTDSSHVGILGTSAGGNIAYMAGALGAIGDTRPEAMVGWSGPAELSVYSGSYYPDRYYSAAANYIGCDLSTCPDKWDDASPVFHVTDKSPPALIFNGTYELVDVQQAIDLYNRLVAKGVTARLCKVSAGDGHLHARQYENVRCDDDQPDGPTVMQRSIQWLHGKLG